MAHRNPAHRMQMSDWPVSLTCQCSLTCQSVIVPQNISYSLSPFLESYWRSWCELNRDVMWTLPLQCYLLSTLWACIGTLTCICRIHCLLFLNQKPPHPSLNQTHLLFFSSLTTWVPAVRMSKGSFSDALQCHGCHQNFLHKAWRNGKTQLSTRLVWNDLGDTLWSMAKKHLQRGLS